MIEKPLVSVIITTYNRPTEIVGRALSSVVEQTYCNLEIILVNDFPENTVLSKQLVSLCNSFDRKVTYLQMCKNSGANAARNFGASFAKGTFVGFLDDDDEWEKKKIECQINLMNNPKIGIVYCNTWIDSEKYNSIRVHYKGKQPEGYIFNRMFKSNIIGSTSFPLIRKQSFDEVRGFNEDLPALQDMDLWLRITRKYEVAYIDEPLGTYHFYIGDRISSNPQKRIIGYENIYAQYNQYLLKNTKIKSEFDLFGITFYVNARDFKKAINLWLEAVRLYPQNFISNGYMAIKIIIRFFIRPKIV